MRGGLTRKYVDVPELVSVVDFEPLESPVLHGVEVAPGVTTYETGCEYFAYGGRNRRSPFRVPADGPRIVACVEGTVTVGAQGTDDTVTLSAGQLRFFGTRRTL